MFKETCSSGLDFKTEQKFKSKPAKFGCVVSIVFKGDIWLEKQALQMANNLAFSLLPFSFLSSLLSLPACLFFSLLSHEMMMYALGLF